MIFEIIINSIDITPRKNHSINIKPNCNEIATTFRKKKLIIIIEMFNEKIQ
jgi:hypothetical protein